jgi:GAF domain-containing protein
MPLSGATPTERFYAPGRRLLQWMERAGLGRDHPFIYFAAPLMLSGAWVWLVLSTTWLASAAVVLTFAFQGFVSYLSGADTLAQRDARQEVWGVVKDLNTDTMGHLAILLRFYRERYLSGGGMDATAFRVTMTGLQQHLLGHIIEVIGQHHGLTNKHELSANWSLFEEDDHGQWFRPVVYDRNMPDRQPSPFRRYPIEQHIPGAATAFLTGEVAYVADTADQEVAHHFRKRASYRCVLSFPVNSGDRVVGVVNVDAQQPEQLTPDLEYLLRHIAYLIGLCEALKGTAYDTSEPAIADGQTSERNRQPQHNGVNGFRSREPERNP